MTRACLTAAALVAGLGLTAVPVMADPKPAFEGYWAANAAWCARAGETGEQTPDWYGRDGVYGLEWGCDLDSLTPTGVGESWAAQMSCLAEGYEYTQSQIFLLTREDRLLILDDGGVQANLVRCPQSEKVE